MYFEMTAQDKNVGSFVTVRLCQFAILTSDIGYLWEADFYDKI